jgi:outer membrane beta-barrel protein
MSRVLISIALLLTFSSSLQAASIEEDFDGLGGNKILLEKAQALNPETQTSVVQARAVSLRNRFEIAPEYSGTFGGDTYSRTQSFGLNLYYHFTPRWAIGVKYNTSFNRLTAEGEAMVDRAYQDYLKNPKNPNAPIPELDYPKSQTLAMINWSPIYGKLNLLDKTVVQFDAYVLAGAGQVELKSGATSTYLGGGGFGFWLNPRFSTRIEMTYQHYQAQYYTGPQDMDLAVAGVQMGWLL